MPRGKFIVLEGIDGSGKRTQLDMLARSLSAHGLALSQISFPNYQGFFGKMVVQFLNGDFGPLDAVDPHFSALLYANDRLESKPTIESALSLFRWSEGVALDIKPPARIASHESALSPFRGAELRLEVPTP